MMRNAWVVVGLLVIDAAMPAPALAKDFRCTPTCYDGPDKHEKASNNRCNGKDLACEAGHSKAALGINVLHFRLAEAKRAAGDKDKPHCLEAARSGAAVARGLIAFHAHLEKTKEWAAGLTYLTRYDGTVDDKQLFAKVGEMDKEIAATWKACGGGTLTTTTEDEWALFGGVPAAPAKGGRAPVADKPAVDKRVYRRIDIDRGGGSCDNAPKATGTATVLQMDSANEYVTCTFSAGHCQDGATTATGIAIVLDAGMYKSCKLENGECVQPKDFYTGKAVVLCDE